MNFAEQEFLARTYTGKDSVFEWGMGSSTHIAAHLGISRLIAIDSVPAWVEIVRAKLSNPTYTFRHADIGPTKSYGDPADDSHKDQWPEYSLEVTRENLPFDVYLVDGRFRVACGCQALLHGRNDSLVLVHDFQRVRYQELLTVADKVEQVRTLAVLRRKASVTDSEIVSLWHKYKFIQGR